MEFAENSKKDLESEKAVPKILGGKTIIALIGSSSPFRRYKFQVRFLAVRYCPTLVFFLFLTSRQYKLAATRTFCHIFSFVSDNMRSLTEVRSGVTAIDCFD